MLVAANQFPGFSKFMQEVFGAEVQVRNKGENLIISMASGVISGTKNGVVYNLSGDRELIKNVTTLWSQALAHLDSASTCTQENEDKGRD